LEGIERDAFNDRSRKLTEKSGGKSLADKNVIEKVILKGEE